MLKNFNYCVCSSFILQHSSAKKNCKTIFEHSAAMRRWKWWLNIHFSPLITLKAIFLFHSLLWPQTHEREKNSTRKSFLMVWGWIWAKIFALQIDLEQINGEEFSNNAWRSWKIMDLLGNHHNYLTNFILIISLKYTLQKFSTEAKNSLKNVCQWAQVSLRWKSQIISQNTWTSSHAEIFPSTINNNG